VEGLTEPPLRVAMKYPLCIELCALLSAARHNPITLHPIEHTFPIRLEQQLSLHVGCLFRVACSRRPFRQELLHAGKRLDGNLAAVTDLHVQFVTLQEPHPNEGVGVRFID
jgi:hypothetical protein